MANVRLLDSDGSQKDGTAPYLEPQCSLPSTWGRRIKVNELTTTWCYGGGQPQYGFPGPVPFYVEEKIRKGQKLKKGVRGWTVRIDDSLKGQISAVGSPSASLSMATVGLVSSRLVLWSRLSLST
ncbi:hypothetical protein CRG98_009027 [Punica granatum]|uniref:Uncharacterized protein n=1 Tax=Punica granatum TaxID=22663 RepID=A0A2I0KPW7_PUNGR|nr:hypothetical protein CRG98_009027 [Punica granatum]